MFWGISVFEIFLITFFTEFITSGNFDVSLIILIINFILSALLFYLNIKEWSKKFRVFTRNFYYFRKISFIFL